MLQQSIIILVKLFSKAHFIKASLLIQRFPLFLIFYTVCTYVCGCVCVCVCVCMQ
jgi:hypothetical protein